MTEGDRPVGELLRELSEQTSTLVRQECQVSACRRRKEAVAMSDDEVQSYVEENAPELDPTEVREFLEGNEKPTSEPGTHVEWAVKQLRHHKEPNGREDHPSLEIVEEEMRRHDERTE